MFNEIYKIPENKISVTHLATDYVLSNIERPIKENIFCMLDQDGNINFQILLKVLKYNKDVLKFEVNNFWWWKII